jgi:hypothetical protein
MTTHMVRKQIYISKRQDEWLKRLSKARGISEAEVIRQVIDDQATTSSYQQLSGYQTDWEKAVEFMQSLKSRKSQFSEPYRWNREEIYEERLNRYKVSDDDSTNASK